MGKFAEAWKAVLAFLSLVVTNAVADWQLHGSPIPQNWGDAVRWLATSLAGAIVVYAKGNADKPAP